MQGNLLAAEPRSGHWGGVNSMSETLYRDSWYIIEHAIRAVLPDEVVRRALCGRQKYRLTLSKRAWAQLEQELPDALDNVETMVTGSVRELCAAA